MDTFIQNHQVELDQILEKLGLTEKDRDAYGKKLRLQDEEIIRLESQFRRSQV